jgi:hypothetical protein
MVAMEVKTLRGTLLASPECVACYGCLSYFFFAAFFAAFFAGAFLAAFLVAMVFYSPFSMNHRTCNTRVAVIECIESQKICVKKKIAIRTTLLAKWNRKRYSYRFFSSRIFSENVHKFCQSKQSAGKGIVPGVCHHSLSQAATSNRENAEHSAK